MQPLVSAIILTHNRKQLVTRAIESVLAQTYKSIECIVVDDASDDGTKEMLSARTDIQYIYVPKEESKGGNYARNKGIAVAKGKYVAMLDDDDYWLPTKTEKQVALIEEKRCDLVYCGSRPEYVLPDGTVEYEEWLPMQKGQGDLSKRIFSHIWVFNCAMMIRKEALEKYGYYDDKLRYWQEYELSIRLAQHSPFYFVNEVLMVFRVDKSEKQRLTNRFDGWRKNAHYIYHKHAELMRKLPWSIKIDALLLYLGEAAMRSEVSGKKGLYMFYKNVRRLIRLPRKMRMMIGK